ncbi:MAG TPA: ABC transporter permease [Bacillota bacterium]|nr:ABC transporter permease [Bacillota bacterium]
MESNNNTASMPMNDAKIEREARIRELKRFWLQFSKRPVAVLGLVIVLIFLVMCITAPLIAPFDPYESDTSKRLLKPGEEGHILGTDELGRDLFSRIIFGSRYSLLIGVGSVGLGALIGIPIGLIAGYYEGKIGNVLMRIMDVFLAFPNILLALIIVSILGPSLYNALIALSIWSIPSFARIARSEVLALKNNEFVEASKAMGSRDSWIVLWHIFPNLVSQLIVWITLNISSAILTGAGLGFLGLGAQPPSPEWGVMLANGRQYIMRAHHLTTYPGLAILFLALGLNLLGDGLRDTLDPRLKD